MDFRGFYLRWSLTALALCGTFVRGRISSCDPSPDAFDSDSSGMFEVYTFEVEEGILLEPRKLIGSLPLKRNSSIGYKFDEPYFREPNNLKSYARPAHFDVAFVNISVSIEENTTTFDIPSETTTAQPNNFFASTSSTFQNSNEGYAAASGSGELLRNKSASLVLGAAAQNEIVVTSPFPFVTTLEPITPSSRTENLTTQCGGAQIFQIYNLDREEVDTHYLAINYDAEDWEAPLLVVIKVTDINDNSPVFAKESLYTQITKDVSKGDVVAHVKATDADVGTNADLRYEMVYRSERRGSAEESPYSPTFLIHEKLGIVTLYSNISDLDPPTKITFKVVVKDRGGKYVANRATASVTISIVDRSWSPTVDPASKPSKGGMIAGVVVSGVVLVVLALFAAFRWRKNRAMRLDAQLQFMMDDENLIPS